MLSLFEKTHEFLFTQKVPVAILLVIKDEIKIDIFNIIVFV